MQQTKRTMTPRVRRVFNRDSTTLMNLYQSVNRNNMVYINLQRFAKSEHVWKHRTHQNSLPMSQSCMTAVYRANNGRCTSRQGLMANDIKMVSPSDGQLGVRVISLSKTARIITSSQFIGRRTVVSIHKNRRRGETYCIT